MSEEKSSYEILQDFAKKTNRQIEFKEQAYPSTIIHPIIYHIRTLYISESTANDCYYACFQDPRRDTHDLLFSGVFFPLPEIFSGNASIREKDFIDKINGVFRKPKVRTGSLRFDSKAVIKTNDPPMAQRVFGQRRLQDVILKALTLYEGLIISVNDYDVNFIPSLKGKPQFGLVTTQEWILDGSLIEKLFSLSRSLQTHLLTNH